MVTSLLAVFGRAFTERHKINHIVASKQPRQQWFSVDEAQELATEGVKVIDWLQLLLKVKTLISSLHQLVLSQQSKYLLHCT